MLVLMAEKGGLMSTNELAKELDVSPLYLRQIAVELERRGIITSVRGAKGGYMLAKNPKALTVEEITKIYEDMSIVPCIKDPNACPFTSTCKTRKLWIELNNCILAFLKSKSLAEVAGGNRR